MKKLISFFQSNHSVAPFYVAASVWTSYVLLFSLYWLKDWLALAILTFAAFLLTQVLCREVPPADETAPWFRKPRYAVRVMAGLILVTALWSLVMRPASLPKVETGTWISDENELISETTQTTITILNSHWDPSHNTVCAVAIVDNTKGWALQDYASTLGASWGLGPSDFLLLFDSAASTPESPVWHLAYGDVPAKEMSSEQQELLVAAFERGYTEGGLNSGISSLFVEMSSLFKQLPFDTTDFYMMFLYNFYTDSGWTNTPAMAIPPTLLLFLSIFSICALLDRRRYRSYMDLCELGEASMDDYIPILWGRD